MTVAVVDKLGHPLMPTNSYRVRKLLKSGRAVIYKYRPVFTIQLLDREGGDVQPVEYKCDTGYQYIGVSVASEKHEFLNRQYDMLADERERHNDRRKYRRARRNRLRYRTPRFDNRKGMICKDGFAPSIRNKRNLQVRLYEQLSSVIPVTKAIFEMGQFDTQLLKAVEEGRPAPKGTDYQQGERYGYDTLREAVFSRDGYKCILCGKSAFDKHIMAVHHLGFWKGDRTNRLSNLATVCTGCHTSKNHKPGGKLYGLQPKLKAFKGATYMTMVRWDLLKRIKAVNLNIEVKITYGTLTKRSRKELNIKKTHSNDAYCMGDFHPDWRTDFEHFRKKRRNNRILEKFYDAKYIDLRDGKKKSGTQLSCNRTNRREPRLSDKNERIYRANKVSKGRRSIRRQRYAIQPNDRVYIAGNKYIAKGIHCNGTRLMLTNGKSVGLKNIDRVIHQSGWIKQVERSPA